ncbi:MAG: hypothetical protein WDZ88_00530, partial [Candidatus Paceibacterota bacterium]
QSVRLVNVALFAPEGNLLTQLKKHGYTGTVAAFEAKLQTNDRESAQFNLHVTRQSDMQVEVEVVFDDNTIDRSLTIDWGDGSVTEHSETGSFWNNLVNFFRRQNSERYTHTYKESGTYTIRATSTIDEQRSVTVFVGSSKGGQFLTASPREGTEPLSVQFETNYGDPEGHRPSTLDAADMLLRFGDGSEDMWLECPNRNDTGGKCSSRPLKIDHVYKEAGTYTAQIVRSGGLCIDWCPGTILESVQITVSEKNVVTSFFEGITTAFRNAFGTVISFLFPDRKGDVNDRDFANLPDTNQTERRSGSMKIGDLEAIIINTGGENGQCDENAPVAFQAYVITVAPPEIGIKGCSQGTDISNYLVAIAGDLSSFHSFEPLTVQELLTLPIYLGNVAGELENILADLDDETPSTEINELQLEVRAKDSGGSTVINWTDKNVSIKPTDELAFRWDASEYDRCLIFLADNGNYSLTRGGDATMRTGNTETEGYNIFERTGSYRIECERNIGSGHVISHGVVFVTVDENAPRGVNDGTYTLDDVRSVAKRSVDPVPEAIDDEYLEYTITLKSGVVHVVKWVHFSIDQEQEFFKTGFRGDVDALIAMANATTTGSYTATNIKTATVQYVDPSDMVADEEYNEYIITLQNGTVHRIVVNVFTNNYDGQLLEKLEKSGYTGTLAAFKAKVTKLENATSAQGAISLTPTEGVAPLNTTFTVVYYGSGTLTFGDGAATHQLPDCVNNSAKTCSQTVTHTYANPGSYAAKLVVGCPATLAAPSVCVGEARVETHAVTVTGGSHSLTMTDLGNSRIRFNGQTNATYPGGVFVDFGNNTNRATCPCDAVERQYNVAGTYTARLIGINGDGSETTLAEQTVVIQPADQGWKDGGWWGNPSNWSGRMYGAVQELFNFGASSGGSDGSGL